MILLEAFKQFHDSPIPAMQINLNSRQISANVKDLN